MSEQYGGYDRVERANPTVPRRDSPTSRRRTKGRFRPKRRHDPRRVRP